MSMTTRQTPDAVREAVATLRNEARRNREEATMDDRAADNAKNPDAEPFFRSTAIVKRERADAIDTVLAALDSRAGDAGEGKTDSEIIAFANRFYDPADNGSGADIRKWIKAVRAALSSTPAPAVDAATERQAALAKLTAMDDDGFPDEPLPISPNVAEQFAENAKSAVDAVPAGEDSHHD